LANARREVAMFNKILIANRGAEQSLAIALVHNASRAARSDRAAR
jgi:hypothetical protein